jgi:1,4-dihydroxy-6-naphthoate synthase
VFAGDFEPVVMSFSEILPAVTEGRIGAGVLISEDQYRVKGLGLKVVDLGAICLEKLGAPLFLGVDAVRSDLPGDVRLAVDRVFRRSVQYALEHEEEALDAAMQYARGLDRETVRGFVKAYVGVHTVHLGAAGCEAIRRFLRLASLRGLVCDHCEARFVGDKPLEEPAHQELHDPH